MTHAARLSTLLWVIVVALAAPAAAANKEHQQLAADIRMLQEQSQILQNMVGSIAESIKSVNTRLDQQNDALRKAFADQKLLLDNLSSDLRVVREKVDDNNVRIASLTQELEALRQSVQQGLARPTSTEPAPGATPGAPPTGGTPGPPPLAVGTSPQQLWDAAFSDYTIGQWDLAIQGFEAYLRSFPKSPLADQAQVTIGMAYDYAGNKQKALEAFDKAIRDYPAGKAIPDAYFRKGVLLLDLKQPDKAREALEYVVKNHPDSTAATQALQRLNGMKKPD